jgi:hypothetical protein
MVPCENGGQLPTTVDAGFVEFASRLTPTAAQREAASKHRSSVEAALQSRLGILRFFQSGSFSNGTGVRGRSDVDYFAVLPPPGPSLSTSALNAVRDALEDGYPYTEVYVRQPAVVVAFEAGAETYEIVPAYWTGGSGTTTVYRIPASAGGWRRSAPDAHLDFVREVDTKHNGKVKQLVRLLKAWKYYRNVPISSFYLEMCAAAYAEGEGSIIYSIDVRAVLRELQGHALAAMNDPSNLVGRIYACSSDTDRNDAISKLNTALTRADKAREAEYAGNISTAFQWWDLVYDGHFPAYG